MFEWIVAIVQRLSYVGIALLTLAENVFPPIPSELIMPLAGFVAERGDMALWGVIAAGTLGSSLGATVWYLLGRRVGEERLRRWVDRHGRWLTISGEDIDRAMRWFQRHGTSAVFFGRLIPGVRTYISLPAGFSAMPHGTFAIATLLGTAIWTAALTWAGFVLGHNYAKVERYLNPVTWALFGGLVLWYLWRVIRYRGSVGSTQRAANRG